MSFNVAKQFEFALASALTATAKEAQKAVKADIGDTFTVRGSWLNDSNAMGIKVLPASKQDLSAAVVTRADWLQAHEEGEDKLPRGTFLAVPTSNVRRTKRDIIRRNQRPRGLRQAVVLPLKSGGKMIFERRGRRLVPVYRLIRRAHIKRESTIVEPALTVFEKRFEPTFYSKLAMAIRTAKR